MLLSSLGNLSTVSCCRVSWLTPPQYWELCGLTSQAARETLCTANYPLTSVQPITWLHLVSIFSSLLSLFCVCAFIAEQFWQHCQRITQSTISRWQRLLSSPYFSTQYLPWRLSSPTLSTIQWIKCSCTWALRVRYVNLQLFVQDVIVLLRLQQIAGYMIILRVAQGRAWSSNTQTLGAVSTNIRFNPPVLTNQGITESQLDDNVIEYCRDEIGYSGFSVKN